MVGRFNRLTVGGIYVKINEFLPSLTFLRLVQTNRNPPEIGVDFQRKDKRLRNVYELVVLLHPDLEIDVEAPITKIEGLIEAVNGRVVKRDNWGKKRLAYRIRRQDFAIYVYFEVELEPTAVRQLENTILITEEVLRHILVDHEESKPKAGAKKSAEKKSDVTAAEEGSS
jgi:small subunit ribosomal protein S6